MKNSLLTALLLLTTLMAMSQTVTFQAWDPKGFATYPRLVKVRIFQGKTVIAKVDELFRDEWVSQLPKEGKYNVEFQTVFGTQRKMELPFIMADTTILLPVTELDYQKEKYKPVIDKLKDGETMHIHFTSDGCFHSVAEGLKIKRKEDQFWAEWTDKVLALKPDQVEAIRRFEMELQYFNERRGCTTVEKYVIEVEGNSSYYKSHTDDSCLWSGFRQLKLILGIDAD
jgi:hypothetical protein